MDRSRSAFWPLLLALVVGLALGFAGGYGVGSRDRGEPAFAGSTPTQPALSEPFERKRVEEPAIVTAESPVKSAESVASNPAATANKIAPTSDPATAIANPAAKSSPSVPARSDAQAAAFAGRLLIRSAPPGALVFVDGRDYGRTPTTVRDLAQGAHRVRLARDGYATEERRVVISASRPSLSVTLTLPRAAAARAAAAPVPAATIGQGTGALSVESRPSGASVFVDGRPVGTTPILLAAIPAGDHAIRLEHDGSRTWSSSFHVVANERSRLTASLER